MIREVIDKLIIVAGSWNALGQKDAILEQEFDRLLTDLQRLTGKSRSESVDYLIISMQRPVKEAV